MRQCSISTAQTAALIAVLAVCATGGAEVGEGINNGDTADVYGRNQPIEDTDDGNSMLLDVDVKYMDAGNVE